MTTKKESRDPLEDFQITRRPGESTYERLYDLLIEKVMFWFVVVALLFSIFIMDLIRYYSKTPPTPWFMLFLVVVVSSIGWYRIRKVWPELRALKQGARGEKAIGELLEVLRQDGYQVFHDLDTGNHGNIDHALIGPGGVYALETKTISKPATRPAKIKFQGDRLLIDGRNPSDFGDRDPTNQARTSASCLQTMLKSCSGKSVFVRPVLLYPGWWVDEELKRDVWVLNPERLGVHLRDARETLTTIDITHLSENLRRLLSK